MIQKLKKWMKRYGGAELCGTAMAVLTSSLAAAFTEHFYWIGLAGAWGENLGFYGWIWRKERHENPQTFFKTLRALILEFGPSELMDTWLTRPFLIGFAASATNSHPAGLLAGKIFADILFYFLCILIAECRTKKPL